MPHDRKIDMATVETLAGAAVEFIANIPVPGGGHTMCIKPQDLPAFVRDRDQWAADTMGVSKAQYLDWVETDGTPRCGATTKSGHRCRNLVSGGIQRSLREWLRLEGGYCAVHGGEPSDRDHRR